MVTEVEIPDLGFIKDGSPCRTPFKTRETFGTIHPSTDKCMTSPFRINARQVKRQLSIFLY